MLEIEKWMEVVQNPETFTESLSFSLCLSSCLPVCECCVISYFSLPCIMLLFPPIFKKSRQIWEKIVSLVFLTQSEQCRQIIYIEMMSGRKMESRETNQNKDICD